MRDQDRVLVRGAHPGTILGAPSDGYAFVRLDSGNSARFALADLSLEPVPYRPTQDKSVRPAEWK